MRHAKQSSDQVPVEQSRARQAKYKWGAVTVIVIAILAYATFTDTPIKKLIFDLKNGSIDVSFAVTPIDQRQGPSVSVSGRSAGGGGSAGQSSSKSTFYIEVPGRERIALAELDSVIIEPGVDDAQNRHLGLVASALNAGILNTLYEESDENGTFNLWLTNRDDESGRAEYSYNTLRVRADGYREIAFRSAYRGDGGWMTLISPFGDYDRVISQSERLDKPRIRSAAQITRALNDVRSSLIRGHYTPEALLNCCFVDGVIREEDFARGERGDGLAIELGLTVESAYAIAEWGYALFKQGEYIGAKTFWQAMLLLNNKDAYYMNTLGVSQELLNQFDDAYRSYSRAYELDPDMREARQNLERMRDKGYGN